MAATTSEAAGAILELAKSWGTSIVVDTTEMTGLTTGTTDLSTHRPGA